MERGGLKQGASEPQRHSQREWGAARWAQVLIVSARCVEVPSAAFPVRGSRQPSDATLPL